MPQTLEAKRIRLPFDNGSYEPVNDAIQKGNPTIWKKSAVTFEIGAFINIEKGTPTDGSEVDVADWESLTLEVKTSDGTSNLMAKTVTAFDETLTAATWTDLTAQHASVSFDDAETNIAAGTYDGVVYVITTSGAIIVLGVFKLKVADSKASFTADPAPLNPGSAISLAQADARYLAIGATDNPNFKRATLTVSLGAESVTWTFTTAFSGTPSIVVHGSVRKASGGDGDPPFVVAETARSASAVTFKLSGPAPAAASLDVFAIL